MWGRNSRKQKDSPVSILSLSSLGTAALNNKQHGIESNWSAASPRWSSRHSSGRPGSVTCSARDDGLCEVIAQHEQLITALGEKVATLEDCLERVQQDVVPALKLFAAVQQAQQTRDATAANKDQDPTPAAGGGTEAAGASHPLQGAGASSLSADYWQQPNLDSISQAMSKALAEMVQGSTGAAAAAAAQDRDDCGSVRSFCTSISCTSTQVSGPALVTDLRPAAKAPSRAPTQYLQQQASMQLGWGGGRADLMAVAGPGGGAAGAAGAGGCCSWPLELGLHEECSAEEIQQMVERIVQHAPESTASSEQQQQQQLDLQRQTISCLALHAEGDEEVRQQICLPGLLARVTDMLQGSDLGCCQAAAHLIWYFSRSHCLRPVLQQQQHLLPALLNLLAVSDAASARAAAFALNNLAMDPTCRHRIVEAGAVAGLIDMLSGCDALGQEAAAAALQMLASEEGNTRAMIVACNGVQALVAVLRYGGPAAQEAAAAALENLSLDDACEAALAQDGAVEALLQVLKDGTTGTQAAAAGALRNLAVNEQLEGHLLEAGMVQVLLELVANSKLDVGVRTAALEGLRNLAASSTRSGDVLVQAGGAAVLVDAARSVPAATARSAALAALLVLSVDDKHRRAIAAAGSAGVLVHAVLSGSPMAKEYAARALANLATTDSNVLELLKEGAATVLAFLLKSQVAGLIAAAAAVKAGGQPPAAVTASTGCCLAATRALQNLAKCRTSAKQLLDAGCIPPLASALIFPGPIATSATSALCNLCTSNKSLEELVKSEGVTKLVQAVAKPKHLTARGQRNALRLLKRFIKGPSTCRTVVQDQVAALGIILS